MISSQRSVTVKRVPETLTTPERKLFLQELETCLNVTRPRIVLDCSQIEKMDSCAVLLLLDCLEKALKLNGDVRLAAVPPDAKKTFGATGAARLFQMFDTGDEAVNSYSRPRAAALQTGLESVNSTRTKHAA